MINNTGWNIRNISQRLNDKCSKVVLNNVDQEAIILEPLDVVQDLNSVLHVLLHVDVEAGDRVVQEDALQCCSLHQVQPPRCDHPGDRVVGGAGPI